MVRAGTGDSGTILVTGSLSGTARTMIGPEDTGTMQSQLGTMVINSDEEDQEEDGTMKSKFLHSFPFPSQSPDQICSAVEKNQKTKTKTVKRNKTRSKDHFFEYLVKVLWVLGPGFSRS